LFLIELAICAYSVIIGDTLPLVFGQWVNDETLLGSLLTSRYIMIVFCNICVALPLSLYRDISKLSRTSAISLFALIFITLAVVIRGPQLPIEQRTHSNLFTIVNAGVFEVSFFNIDHIRPLGSFPLVIWFHFLMFSLCLSS
jgi:sodium-coupled neutral amino acid transporter 11